MKQRLLIGLYCIATSTLYGAFIAQTIERAGIAQVIERAGIEDAEGALTRSLTEGLVESGSSETLNALSPEIKNSLLEELSSVLKSNKVELETGRVNIDDITKQLKEKFYNNIQEFGSQGKIDIQSQSALSRFKFEPNQLESINNFEQRPSSALSTSEITINPVASPETTLLIDADKLMSAQAESPAALKQAQSVFNTSLKNLASQNDALVNQAEGSLSKASENLETISAEANADKTLQAQQELKESTQNLEDAQQVKKEGERLSNRQKLKIAQEKLTLTDQQLSANSDALKEAQQELKSLSTASKQLEQATTALSDASEEEKPALEKRVQDLENKVNNKEQLTNDLNKKIATLNEQKDLLLEDRATLKGDVTTQGSIRSLEKAYLETTDQWEVGLRAKSALAQLKDSVSSMALSGVSSGVSLLSQSVVFMLPSIGLSMWQAYMGNKAVVDTLKESQTFGNILMKIPDDFINHDQPQFSKFVYVGLPSADTALSDEFLKTANYYVTKPSFGEPGSVAITDPSFSGQMIHLNTGYVFMGDGGAADVNNPTMPFFGTASNSLSNLIEKLSAGMASGGTTSDVLGASSGIIVDSKAHYKGNQTIASLFSPKRNTLNTADAVPPLLINTFKSLQNGTTFGQFHLKGFTDLPSEAIKKMTNATLPPAPTDDIAYVAKGIYLYQTQDTPLIKSVLASVNDTELKKSLTDYVVVLDSELNYSMVPLEIPLPNLLKSHFAEYRLSLQAKKTYYVMSLLDFSVYGIDFSLNNKKITGYYGTPSAIDPASYAEKTFAHYPSIVRQIQEMRSYVNSHKKYGPFSQGSVSLSIDQTLADQGVFVYQWEKSLENQQDDYLVAVQIKQMPNVVQPCLSLVSLPSSSISFFISLVTSRFYDSTLNAYQPPLYPYSNYYIVAPNSNPTDLSVINYGTKRQPENSMIVYARPSDPSKNSKTHKKGDATASLFTLFIDGDINPNELPNTQSLPDGLKHLPVPIMWALNSRIVVHNDQPLGSFLQQKAPALYRTILDHHSAWKKWSLEHNPHLIAQQMVACAFAQSALHTIYLTPTSTADIEHGNYIYTSPDYPGEYILMIDDPALNGLGQQFNNQRYALSLSNGMIYDAQQQGAPIENRIESNKLYDILSTLSLLKPLNQAISNSQQAMLESMQSNLIGPDVDFGAFNLYLNQTDFYHKQFIYAQVNNLEVLKADGTENTDQLRNVSDYLVCFDPTTKSFGMQMSGSIEYMVSLVSGIIYNRAGAYVGVLNEFNGNNIMDATQNIIKSIEQSSSQKLRPFITQALQQLTKLSIAHYQQEQALLKKLKEQDKKYTEPLSANIVANCMSAPYVHENPSLNPQRFLKRVGERYYRVLSSSDNTITLIIDYDVQGCAIVYQNNNGTFYPINSVQGKALEMMRSAAGISVNPQGKQSLGLPLTGMSIDASSMTQLDTSTIYYNLMDDMYYSKQDYKGVKTYINLLTAQVYNLDGTAHLEQYPLYSNAAHAFLYQGIDNAGIPKFILSTKNSCSSYSSIQSYPSSAHIQAWRKNGEDINWTSVKTSNNILNYGILYVLVNDTNLSQTLRVTKVLFDQNMQKLNNPYFMLEKTNQTLEKYTQSPKRSISLLSYAQTRAIGSKEGNFIAKDMIDQQTGVQHWCALILNTSTQRPEMIIYENTLTPLSSPLSVKLDSLKVASFRRNDQANRWVSINDMQRAYDYVYSYAAVPLEAECDEINLSCIHQALGLYTTPYIDYMPSKTYQALVNPLNTLLSMPLIQSSEHTDSQRAVYQERSKGVRVDQQAIIYNAHRLKHSVSQRFVIKLSLSMLKESGIDDKSLAGCYVDLYNGVVYVGSIPNGRSLSSYQLNRLNEWLGIQLISKDSQTASSIEYR